jgi:hypothetical protein
MRSGMGCAYIADPALIERPIKLVPQSLRPAEQSWAKGCASDARATVVHWSRDGTGSVGARERAAVVVAMFNGWLYERAWSLD